MKKFIAIIIIVTQVLFSQQNIQIHKGIKYAKYDDLWYLQNDDGSKGDLVDTNNVIISLKHKAIMDSDIFKGTNLSILKNVRGRFSNGFYELNIPKHINSMKTLNTISNMRLIDIAYFNIIGVSSGFEPDDSCFVESLHWNYDRRGCKIFCVNGNQSLNYQFKFGDQHEHIETARIIG